MHRVVAVVLLLPFLFLSACKIRIVVPEGGTVRSQSGAYQCAGGGNCVIEVSDTFFDETFVAEAESGYRFAGWRKRHRSFCGGNAGPCRLATSGFGGDANLMQVLESDQVFFLEPVFESTEPGDLGNEHGEACFNAALLQEGGGFETRYRSPDGFGGFLFTDYIQVVDGQGTFNGNTGRRIRIIQSTEANPGSYAEAELIFTPNIGSMRVRQYGLRTQVTEPQTINVTNAYTPFKLVRWDLAAGESFTQEYNQLVDQAGQFSAESHVELTTTYEGTETITVPAGTFKACRVEEVFRETGGSGVTTVESHTLWYGLGTGILLREVSDETDVELVSGTVNGQAL